MRKVTFWFISFLALVALGCGGGGGSNDTPIDPPANPPPTNPPPVNPPPQVFTLSGTIESATGSASDSDVNDPDAPYSSNDDFASAQTIPNPVTLGGYVNEARAGFVGPSWLYGDYQDYYYTYLYDGQWIRLSIADPTSGDVDLYLVDELGNVVDTSIGTGKSEAIPVPSSGYYYIVVDIYAGASNYVLVNPQTALSPGGLSSLRLGADFVEGDVVVRFKEESGKGYFLSDTADRSRSAGLRHNSSNRGGAELMSFRGDEERDRAFRKLGIKVPDRKFIRKLFASDKKKAGKYSTLQVIKALRKRSDVLYAEPNYIHRAQATPDDTFYAWQWHYPLIHLSQAWDITTGDNNVIVGVIDTGVLLNHPDLQGQMTSGYDFISDSANALDGDGIDPDPNDPGDQSGPNGLSSFHGTHVTGTIAATTNNNQGVAGIAYGAKIMPLRVLGLNGGTTSDTIEAMYFAAGLVNASGTLPPNPAAIINMSLGGSNFSQAFQDAVTDMRNAGVIIIAAAGNDSTDMPSYPAAYDGVISVSAVDIEKNLAPYSNYGPTVDVAAPGGDMVRDLNGDGMPDGVYSTAGDDSTGTVQYFYDFMQGTSMASPHMAGVVALMKSVEPNLTPEQLDSLLASGLMTQDLGLPGRDDQFGHGLIDAYEAIVAAGNLTSGNPFLVANPASFNFDYQSENATLSITNGGGGSLSAGVPTDDADWLTVTATNIDADNLGTYTLTVDRTGLSNNTYVANITIISSVNTINIPVTMQVQSTSGIENAGLQHVLLIDANTSQTVDGVLAGVSNGRYDYSFSNVAEGVYYIASGTNMDNDSYICDSGEACGGYLTTDFLTPIVVDSNLAGLDFITSFNFSISAQSENNSLNYPEPSQFPPFKLPMK